MVFDSNTLLLKIDADIKGLKSELAKANKEIEKFAKGSESSSKNTKKGFLDLKQAASSAFGFSFASLLGKASGVLLEFGKDSIATAVKSEQAWQSFNVVVGESADTILNDLRKAADGMVADFDLVNSANRALALGIEQNNLSEFMEVARARSKIMGTSVTKAFEDITIGVGRQSRLILDNLGIILDLDKAYENYAETLGKTSDELSDSEKKLAVQNEVLRSSQAIVKAMSVQQELLITDVQQATAEFKNLANEVGINVVSHFGNAINAAKRLEEGFEFAPEVKAEMQRVSTSIINLDSELRTSSESIRSLRDELLSLSDVTLAGETESDIRVSQKSNELDKEKLKLLQLEADARRAVGDEDRTAELNSDIENQKIRIEDVRNELETMRLENKIEFDNFKGIMGQKAQLEVERRDDISKTKEEFVSAMQDKITQWDAEKEAIKSVTDELDKYERKLDDLGLKAKPISGERRSELEKESAGAGLVGQVLGLIATRNTGFSVARPDLAGNGGTTLIDINTVNATNPRDFLDALDEERRRRS